MEIKKSMLANKSIEQKSITSFSIFVQNFLTSLEIFSATFLNRCSSSCTRYSFHHKT